jgi:tetratricopeptide (TPR) repeat protein
MSKFTFHLLLITFISFSALAHASEVQCANQPQPSSEIRKVLSAARQDELSGRWDEALQRLDTKRNLSPEEQAARVRILVEQHLTFKQDRANTLRVAEQTLERVKQACNKTAIASVQHSIGRIYYWDAFANGKFEASKPYFVDALELRTQMADKAGMADSEFYLGLIDQMQTRPEAAMTHFRQSLEWAREANDKLLQSFAIRHIAALDADAGKLPEAERGFRQSLALREQARAQFLVPFARLAMADIVEQKHGDQKAVLKMTEQAVKEAQRSHSVRALVAGEISLSQRLQKAGQHQQAIEHARLASVAAEQLGDPEMVNAAQEQLTKVRQNAIAGSKM